MIATVLMLIITILRVITITAVLQHQVQVLAHVRAVIAAAL